jgi:hypothetical protein
MVKKKAAELQVGDTILSPPKPPRVVAHIECSGITLGDPVGQIMLRVYFLDTAKPGVYDANSEVEVLPASPKPSIRTKFIVASISKHYEKTTTRVKLLPLSLVDSEENRTLWTGTTVGAISLDITTDTAEYFVLGQKYYIDFTKANE